MNESPIVVETPQESPQRPVFEHHMEIIQVDPDVIMQVLAAAGKDGWELAGTLGVNIAAQPTMRDGVIVAGGGAVPGVMLFFKRLAS